MRKETVTNFLQFIVLPVAVLVLLIGAMYANFTRGDELMKEAIEHGRVRAEERAKKAEAWEQECAQRGIPYPATGSGRICIDKAAIVTIEH